MKDDNPKKGTTLTLEQEELAKLLQQGKSTLEIKRIMGDRYYLATTK